MAGDGAAAPLCGAAVGQPGIGEMIAARRSNDQWLRLEVGNVSGQQICTVRSEPGAVIETYLHQTLTADPRSKGKLVRTDSISGGFDLCR